MGAAAIPAWVAWTSLGLTAAGTAVAVQGQRRAGQYEQAVAKQNASLAEKAAVDAEARGRIEESQHRARVNAAIGTAKAQTGASGVVTESGSALDALADIAYVGESDALTIKRNAAMEAWGLRTQGVNALAQGRLSKTAANYGAAASFLQGAGAFGGQLYSMPKTSKAPKTSGWQV
jgi:hypothetical protein